MSTYKNLIGKDVNFLTTNPDNAEAEGQIWYNSTDNAFKGLVVSEAWSSSTPLTTAREWAASSGSQTAAIVSGGYALPSTAYSNTEEYNGSGWAAGGALNTARGEIAGNGPQTAALVAGGDTLPGASNASETYNGSSWTSAPNLNLARYSLGAAKQGTTTAALVFGGYAPSPAGPSNTSEEFNGSSWSEGNNLNTARNAFPGSCAGTQTAGLATGGSPFVANCEEYDGTSWTNVNGLNTARQQAAGGGSQTAAFLAGGQTPPNTYVAITETYDGTNWTTSPATLSSPNIGNTGAGDSSAGLSSGGYNPTRATVEEYNRSINVITAAAWSSGGLMGTGRYRMSGQNIGTKDAGMAIGGRGSFPSTAPAVTVSSVEEYDGSSWSEVNNMPTSLDMMGSFGVQTAALQFAGYGGPGAGPNPGPGGDRISPAVSNEYDGTNWTSSGAYPAATNALAAAGTQTAGLGFAGSTPGGVSNITAEYDGSSWTASNNIGTARDALAGAGIQTAALAIGGPPSPEARVEEYDGTNWTTGGALPTGNNQSGTGGTQTNALSFGGNTSPTTLVLGYDGTSWSTRPSISTARYGGSNGNSTTSGAYFAGGGGSADGTQRQTTEEFTGETSALNIKTITTS